MMMMMICGVHNAHPALFYMRERREELENSSKSSASLREREKDREKKRAKRTEICSRTRNRTPGTRERPLIAPLCPFYFSIVLVFVVSYVS